MTTGERRDQHRGWELRENEVQARHLADDIIDDSHLSPTIFGAVGQISVIDPDDAAVAGVTGKVADAGHQHAITTGTPVSVGLANAEGAGTGFARDTHVHGINVPAVRAVWSANTSVANDSSAAVAWGGADLYDTDTMHNPVTNNTRITFSTAGVYKVGGWYQMAADADGSRAIAIRLNATTDIAIHNKVTAVFGGATNDTMAIETEYKFAAADFVELIAAQTGSGVSLNVTGGGFWASYRTAG